MVELFERDIKTDNRQSSKGNQLKWFSGKKWYKADYTGYEGLAEYMISNLLKDSNLNTTDYIVYETEEIRYEQVRYRGCRSDNFLPDGWQLITLERLFQSFHGQSLSRSLYCIDSPENRLRFLVEQIERITMLKDFGIYLSRLLAIDTFFLNEDRHTHNIAVLLDEEGHYQYCPIFDNGAALLSDTTMDYPIDVEINDLMKKVAPKTFCSDFDEQIDLAERLYGKQIKFTFTKADVMDLLEKEMYYPDDIKNRVAELLTDRMRKYSYLF